MDSFDEDGEIKDDVRHHPSRKNDDRDDDEFSMSSYDGEQTDSLVIKPPQAVVLHRDKKEKREKRDRHRHKGERHKDRHRIRERGSGHEERRREHRRHRERDGERRENKRHEKHRERGSNKHERPIGDLRNKLLEKDRKMNEREQARIRERAQRSEEYFVDDRDLYEQRPRDHSRATGSQMLHHRERRLEKPLALPSLMGLDLSPHEKSEREKRMERFMLAEKQKEITQREADVRRQRREEERREEKRMEELRQRAEESMLRNTGRSYSDQRMKRKKKHIREEPETVELISDDDEKESAEEEEVMEVGKDNIKYDRKKRKIEEEEEHSQTEENEVRGSTPKSASSGPTAVTHNSPERTSPPKSASHSDSSSSSSSDDDDDDDDEDDDDDDDDDEDATDEDEESKNQATGDVPSGQGNKILLDDQSRSGSSSGDTTDDEKKGDSDDEMIGVKKETFAHESPATSPAEIKEKLPPYFPAIMGCRSVDEFECLNRIEEGTYGVVYRAREKSTNEIVALKRLKMEKEKEGFPITSLREVNTLLKGQHDNIVTVREIVVGSNMDKIYIVMDYVEHDLKSLMETMRKKKQTFTIGEVKTLMIQLLRAVHHLHDNWILHRDLKTSNLLLSHRGILKVGDFGLAREYGSPLKQYTPIVVTLWYRAPELLLGTKEYSCPIDVWSVGCIFGELLGMEPMFPGKSEIDQLNKIFKDLGTPSDKIWPGYTQMPVIKKTQFAYYPYNHLKERFKTRLSTEGFALLNSFLTYNPAKRITCVEGLKHDYFYNEEPAPIDPAMFPTWPAKSENPHGGRTKKGLSPKPPSGGKNFKALGDGEDESIAGFFLGGAPSSGPGFTLKF